MREFFDVSSLGPNWPRPEFKCGLAIDEQDYVRPSIRPRRPLLLNNWDWARLPWLPLRPTPRPRLLRPWNIRPRLFRPTIKIGAHTTIIMPHNPVHNNSNNNLQCPRPISNRYYTFSRKKSKAKIMYFHGKK